MSVAVPVIDYIDGANKRIYLLEGVDAFHWIEDVYREYIDRRANDVPLRNFAPMVFAEGNKFKQPGKYSARLVTLLNGTRVIPFDENILITITGEAITDNAITDPDPFDTSTRVQPLKLYITPPNAEIVRDEVSLAAIAQMSFDKEIWHDHTLGTTLAEHIALGRDPNVFGNNQYPISNHSEAVVVAKEKRIHAVRYTGNHSGVNALIEDVDLSGFLIHGDNPLNDILELGTLPNVLNAKFKNLTVYGELDGGALVENCMLLGLTYFNGMIYNCALSSAPIYLAGSNPSFFMDCKGFPNAETASVIDSNHTKSDLVMRGYNGGLLIKNVTDPDVFVTVTFRGKIIIDASCTAGTWNLSGTGEVINNSALDISVRRVQNPEYGADAVMARIIEGDKTLQQMISTIAATTAGKASGAGTGTMTYRNVSDTKNTVISEVDGIGNRTAITYDP